MKEKLEAIKAAALVEVDKSSTSSELEAVRVKYLGKKGELTAILRGMGALSAEERPVVGKVANEVRTAIENALKDSISAIKSKERAKN